MSGEYKRLYRSRDDRMISGVCGGDAKYFEIDPTLVRLLFVIFAFAGGPGLVAYIVLAIVVPEVPLGAPAEPEAAVEIVEPETKEGEPE